MSKKKIHLTIATANLLPGGAERVLSFVATELDKEIFDVSFVVFGYEKDASYNLDGISVTYFEKSRVLNGIYDFFKFLKRNKPDIVLTAVGHMNTVAAYFSWFFPKIKFVAREVTVLSAMHKHADVKFSPFSFLSKKRFKYLDALICQSDDMKEDIKKSYSFDYDKMVVINNPISDGFEVKAKVTEMNPVEFITVGRLAKEKGYDRILKVLSQFDRPFNFTIIGRGPEKDHIFKLIDDYKLADKITFVEYTSEVPKYLRKSHVFLQGAYVEGFPNAVIESASVGTPVLAFDAPGGLGEIIEDGITGFRVFTAEEYLEALESICKDYPFEPQKVSESVNNKYHKDIIVKRYESFFQNLLNGKNGY